LKKKQEKKNLFLKEQKKVKNIPRTNNILPLKFFNKKMLIKQKARNLNKKSVMPNINKLKDNYFCPK
jgi:hypothetical protein